MKFTLSWLKDHLDTSASLDEISKTLTAIGLEVESITDRSEALGAFTVAKILHAEKHPEADKLRVCKVLSDAGELQIVCGAPNARAGIFVALAKEGALIPRDGFVIKKTKIRGVESNGMLCSADELRLGGDSEGIIELPEAAIGAPIAEVLGLTDPVIDIAVTPNRADCLGVRGIARDLAAAGLGTLKDPGSSARSSGENFESPIKVSIQTPHCQQFIGIYLKGVSNQQSPAWLKQRLEAIDQKPISALVDITNYITIDLGRPLHVYDADKLKGSLTVRGAKAGEPLHALNDKHYELSEGMCVIADESGAVALGGIIGGTTTGCDANTKNVFLEVALFDAAHVAVSGRTLQINSDARYRFERGLDVAFAEQGAAHAAAMIGSLCGGEASKPVIAGNTPDWKRQITFNHERVKTLGGVDVDSKKCQEILTSLGFNVIPNAQAEGSKDSSPMARNDNFSVTPPSWRADIEGEADLVEEILRIHGYNHIPETPLAKPSTVSHAGETTLEKRAKLARNVLPSRGYLETCSYSFISRAEAELFGGNNPALTLQNPISADLEVMRPSLIPSLLIAAQKNSRRGLKDLQLFEIGLQYHGVKPDEQRLVAAAITTQEAINPKFFATKVKISGKAHEASADYIAVKPQTTAFFSVEVLPIPALKAKSEAIHLLGHLGLAKCDVTTGTPAWYHPGRSGALTLGGKIILGYFGELHPALLAAMDIDMPLVAFEIFLGNIPEPRAKGKAKPPLKLSDFPAVERDFAFIVDQKVPASDIEKALRAAEKNLITDVQLFDVYAGKGVEAGQKSVAVRVTLQSFERTLSEDDIAGVSRQILQAAGKFGGVLRQ
ncbi:MAG: phenylalanine--tRNA ligase subunit beta [Rickettsiales bacterium]|jgi:phenylalanyl-tRNA synthetase beta chain|nr:phenylalanine--tRNA ligase subunit beta [Rickettsiales bacterium]